MSENEILVQLYDLKPVMHEPIGKVGHDLLLFTDVYTHTLVSSP